MLFCVYVNPHRDCVFPCVAFPCTLLFFARWRARAVSVSGIRGEHSTDVPQQVRSVRPLLRLQSCPRALLRALHQACGRPERRLEAQGNVGVEIEVATGLISFGREKNK